MSVCLISSLAQPVTGQGAPDWQQHVRYEMDVTLHTERHQMDGTQRLTYVNNSPDTLRQVFYHLYFNAFQPQSMMAERNRHLPDPDGRIVPRIWNLGPDEVGYHRVEALTQDGEPVAYDLTDTVLRVMLNEPILPGDSTVFAMRFHSQVPLQTRRSGRDNREGIAYSMSQWYPKLANYDERGWHADPYVGREFYAPFGTFDVRITLPAHFVAGGTGVLQNPDAIGHGYQTDTTATYTYDPADSLTWHFHAENVHDFAWVADPDYRHDRIEGDDGVTYHLLYQPDVAPAWQSMRQWAPGVIQALSELVGLYPYPQFTVAQAGDGGMEYPMVNFITGRRSPMSLLGVTAHEAAHEWFYGVLGSNEADYSWMDEGFTTYISSRAMARVLDRPPPSYQGNMLGILAVNRFGIADRFNTPADWYETNAAFGVASYSGGAMVADMLGYVISDSLRDAFLHEYFRRFTFHHPTPYDVEKVAEDVSGLQLDWYFEQFLNTTRTLDYAVADLDSRRAGQDWRTTVTLRRNDPVVVPADVRLTLEDGSTRWVHVPLGIMQGHKPVPQGWIVAEPWLWTFPKYTLAVTLPQRVVKAELDPLARTPDRNRLNNSSGFPMQARFLQPPQQTWMHYSIGYRPLALYADAFGVGVGVQTRGAYLFGDHRLRAMLTLWPEVLFSDGENPDLEILQLDDTGSFFDGIDYELAYARPVRAFGTNAMLELSAQKHLGFLENELALSKTLSGYGHPVQHRLHVGLLHQYNPSDRVFPAPLPTTPGAFEPVNRFLEQNMASAVVTYEASRGDDRLAATIEVGGSLRENTALNANRFVLEAVKSARLDERLRGVAAFKLGLGAGFLTLHKRFRLGAASFEDAWRNDAFRSIAATLDDPRGDAHLVPFEGAGPVAYLLGRTPTGTNVLAGSLRLVFSPPFGSTVLDPLEFQFFSGLGTAWTNDAFDEDEFVGDAGVGLAYDVAQLRALRRWTGQSDVLSGLKLVARFPIWASDPDLIDPDDDTFAFRWLLGIGLGG